VLELTDAPPPFIVKAENFHWTTVPAEVPPC
jgi:hypothetical protein